MTAAPSRNALGWLEQESSFRTLTDRADRLLSLQGELRQCAPALNLVAMGIEQDVLVVGTQGAASAAKLRQLEPTILARLAQRGWQVRRIRFRPLSRGDAPLAPPVNPRSPIPAGVLPALEALQAQVEGESLKRALAHLASSQRRARGG